MVTVNPDTLWFNTPDTNTLCRAGGNGPQHPSQLYAIKKYVKPEMSFLDYGCGSGTTLEALIKYWINKINLQMSIDYKGMDIIPKNVEWCRQQWPQFNFEVNTELHKITQPDKSWDVVYSRHVVDHMRSFEEALDEHCRVAKKLVIIVLWRPLGEGGEHQIKNIVDQGKVYENEYTNDYSREKVVEACNGKSKEGWKTLEITEGVGKEVKGWDTVIVLQKS